MKVRVKILALFMSVAIICSCLFTNTSIVNASMKQEYIATLCQLTKFQKNNGRLICKFENGSLYGDVKNVKKISYKIAKGCKWQWTTTADYNTVTGKYKMHKSSYNKIYKAYKQERKEYKKYGQNMLDQSPLEITIVVKDKKVVKVYTTGS